MPPRFDAANLRLEVAVADLLEADLRRNLGFAQRGGYERLWVGQAIHRRYQEEVQATDPTYQSEVPLTVGLTHRGWEITIRGRIDGLRRQADGTAVVEEIKSVRRDAGLPTSLREIYERQALLYAWMLRLQGERQVSIELILIETGKETVDRQPLSGDLDEVERRVRRRLTRLIRDFERQQSAVERRRDTAERLRFPYSSVRAGQDRILERVELALEQKAHILLEAPTGIGKTVATLLPALRHALRYDKRIFVLTAKTLQQEMATTVLELLNSELAFHSLRLRAKAKMCANGEVICHEEFCPYAKDYYLKLHRTGVLDSLLASSGTLRPDAVYTAAREAEVCPFEVSLELTGQAQVVVCDYNYVFDPYVALHEFSGETDLDDLILVIDEIHNLVERGRGYYSPELTSSQARAAAESLLRGKSPARQQLVDLCRTLEALVMRLVVETLQEQGTRARAAETLLPEEDFWALRPDFDAAFVDYLDHQRETSSYQPEDPFVDLYFDFLRFLDGLDYARDDRFSQYVEFEGDEGRVKILCKDPSRFIGRVLDRVHSAVGLSATISPPDFYLELLGFNRDRTKAEKVPSPFPEENRQIVIDDSVSTLWRERAENYQPIADRLTALAEAVPGNCLALFPSYGFLDEVASRLGPQGKQVLIQGPRDSDRQREEFLELLRSPLLGNVLLLAVAGGVFAEGVDYPGDMLRAVAIVGPCLPAVSIERELLKAYYQDRFDRGFEYAFVVPGMTRVVQAAGRLIRSSEDTGIVALFDRRFLYPPYRYHIPERWSEPDQLERFVGNPGEAATAFFASLVRPSS
jgi:DNA excision repair protein ERCC-2